MAPPTAIDVPFKTPGIKIEAIPGLSSQNLITSSLDAYSLSPKSTASQLTIPPTSANGIIEGRRYFLAPASAITAILPVSSGPNIFNMFLVNWLKTVLYLFGSILTASITANATLGFSFAASPKKPVFIISFIRDLLTESM